MSNSRPGFLKGFIEKARNKSAAKQNKPKPLARHIAALFNHVDNAETAANELKFMQHVVLGRSAPAQVMLLDSPDLYFTRIPKVIDHSGRIFTNITAAEYYYWSNDFDSLQRMIESMPAGQERDDERDVYILNELIKQIDNSEKNGIRFELNGKSYHQMHYSDQAHIDVLREYCKHYATMSEEQRQQFWISKVGSVQRDVHVCIALQLCSKDDNYLNLLGIQQATDTSSKAEWFPLNDDLGTKFAITHVSNARGAMACEAPTPDVVAATLAIIQLAEGSKVLHKENFKLALKSAQKDVKQLVVGQALNKTI